MPQAPPVVLTIAGFDPSSGAGVTADIKTVAAHGCYAISAITAFTVQSTGRVRRLVPTDPQVLGSTLDELLLDGKVSAVHIGMLGSGKVAERVDSPNTHGTGCAFATAIACQLALGKPLRMAVGLAKAYVSDAIKNSYSIGRGPGPVNHMYRLGGNSKKREV